ncbi:MAG: response regulator transcription factor [Verrucomicrobia bacterium]|nr:response regulator transcription factor [Verrucomicrobiota bacterium]
MSIKVSIVEDRPDTLQSLAALIGGSDGFCCVGAHATAESALKHIAKEKPHILLLDLGLPKMSGLECLHELNQRNLPGLKIVILTATESPHDVFEALEAGASGYLVKPTQPAKLLEALAEVANGGGPMSSQIALLVLKSFHQRGRNQRSLEKLSPREEEILGYVAKGFRTAEIAKALSVSARTVSTHLCNIYEKLHVRSRAEAVAKFLRP